MSFMEIEMVRDQISLDQLKELAQATFGDMVKIVVDLKREIVAVGGELHADAEALLLEDGSEQTDLWGANIYPDLPAGKQIVYTSLINIRPKQGNRSNEVQDPAIRDQMRKIIRKRLGI